MQTFGRPLTGSGFLGIAARFPAYLRLLRQADIAELLGVIGIISTLSEQRFTDYRNNAALSITEQRPLKRLIFMGTVGIYNKIPDEIDGEDNLSNEPAQIPNRKAVDVVEASSLNYTVLRPSYLGGGDENDYVLTVKVEPAKGYTTPIPALVKFAVQLILNDDLYSRESVSITQDAAVKK